MSNKNTLTTDLKVLREQRINDDLFGVKFGVEVNDEEGKPVQWQPFKLNADGEIIIDSMTDDEGKFEGQKVLNIRKGTQRKVELVLESGEVIATVNIPQVKDNGSSDLAQSDRLAQEVQHIELNIQNGEVKLLKEGVYKIDSDILIDEDSRLIIEPGTRLEFSEGAGIFSRGKLIVVGTKEKPIIFTNDKEQGKSWRNICLVGKGSVGSSLKHCIVENGRGGREIQMRSGTYRLYDSINHDVDKGSGYGAGIFIAYTGLVDFEGGDDTLICMDHVVLRNNACTWGGGIQIIYGSLKISNSEIINNQSSGDAGGIGIDNSRVKIIDSVVKCNAGENGGGINVGSQSIIKMINSTVTENRTTGKQGMGGGIRIGGGNSRFEIRDSEVSQNASYFDAGISSHGARSIIIAKTRVVNNTAEDGPSSIGFMDDTFITLDDVEISGNHANGVGGSGHTICTHFASYNPNLTIKNLRVIDNINDVNKGTIQDAHGIFKEAVRDGRCVMTGNTSRNFN